MFGKRMVTGLVVGAGPVGLFTALSLARRGQSVRLIDRGVRTNYESFALALHPLSLSLLEGVGLAEEALAMGLRVPRVSIEGLSAKPWSLEFRETSARFPYLLILPQGPFEGLLVRALRREGVEVEWNRALDRLEMKDDRVVCQIDHLADQAMGYAISGMPRMRVGASRVEAGYVIGTDGVWSTVRRELGIGWRITAPRRRFEVYEFPVRDSRELPARVVRTEFGTMAQWPLPMNRVRLTFESIDESDAPLGLGTLTAHCTRLGVQLPLPEELYWCSRVDFEPGVAEKMGAGRCWLAGDSAHRALPFGVQSMNAGLTEAALLASRVSDGMDQQSSIVSFEDYEESRQEEWNHLLGTGTEPLEMERRAVLPATGRLHRQLLEHWGLAMREPVATN